MAASNYEDRVTMQVPMIATGTVTKERFIKADGSQAGLGERAIGSASYDVVSGDDATAKLGIVRVLAGGTVSQGDKVTSDADGKAIAFIENSRKVIKGADEGKTSDTTFADDEVIKDILARISKSYKFKMRLVVKNEDSSAQTIKYKLVVPSGATAVGSILEANKLTDTLTLVDDDADLTASQTTQIDAPASGASSETGIIIVEGVITLSTTAGNIDLQWAQNASVASALSVMAESTFEIDAVTPEVCNGIANTAGTASAIMKVQTF